MEGLLHIGHVWLGIVPQQGVHGHDDARRAEPTLGAVSLRYSFLQQTHAGTREAEERQNATHDRLSAVQEICCPLVAKKRDFSCPVRECF